MTVNGMTGRDLILYILENNLEDELVFNKGKLLGFMNAVEAATKFNVGLSTIKVWMDTGKLPYLRIGSYFFIPSLTKDPRDKMEGVENKNEKQIIRS